MRVWVENWSVYVGGLFYCDFWNKKKAEECAEKLRKERSNENIDIVENGYYEYI